MKNFTDFGLHPDLLRGVADLGFSRATPIQADAIPPALEGKDVLACAMTGSGKTAAFLLPIMQRLLDRPRGKTRVLILTPTRELAAQIAEHLEGLAQHTGITGAAIFGGVAIGPQERAFRAGVDILIATPGRLLDHFQHPYAKLDELEVLVLDEADRMLDMGFLPDVRRVLSHLPARPCQTLFFSATLPPPIVALSQEMLDRPVSINVERKSAPATGITQALYPVAEDLKPYLLLELLRRGEFKNVLVFTRTKHRTNRLAEFLTSQGVACDRLHGNRSQAQRTDALARFKDGSLPVLVATDIAARGIDVEALSHVVNFDVPNLPEDYIHRVGRTARAEAEGDAFTFVSPQEEGDLAAIERAVGKRLPRRQVEGFDYSLKPTERFEIPIGERIAAIRARKAEERARAKAKAERKSQNQAQERARLEEKSRSKGDRQPAPQRSAQGGQPGGGPSQRPGQPQQRSGQPQQRSGKPAHQHRQGGQGGGGRQQSARPGKSGGGSGGGPSNAARPWFLPESQARAPQPPAEPSGTVTDRERKIAQTFAPRPGKIKS
ncbi:MAG TPA: DEAD/DEAH box helicase [Thermoanaerobaculia bacterium]|nr:DEAD/DEAH box helicase [Thermoanaerobaculia bacterium]